jgi:rRNA processing protein Gar1
MSSKAPPIGTVLHQSKGSKNLIMKLEADAKIGQLVSDKSGTIIGKIFDIFGPIESPYASIRLSKGVELDKVNGKPVYLAIIPARRDRSKRRKKSR